MYMQADSNIGFRRTFVCICLYVYVCGVSNLIKYLINITLKKTVSTYHIQYIYTYSQYISHNITLKKAVSTYHIRVSSSKLHDYKKT